MVLVEKYTNRSINKIENPDIDHIMESTELDFRKWRKDIQQMVLEQLDVHMQKKIRLDTDFTP